VLFAVIQGHWHQITVVNYSRDGRTDGQTESP